MKKRIIAFNNFLLYAIVCIPLIVIAAVLLYTLVTRGTGEWIRAHWGLVIAFAVSVMVPIVGAYMIDTCDIENDEVRFYHMPLTKGWEKAVNNIDARWNHRFLISEVAAMEIVKLTKEEKRAKVYYRHWFNRYLKITFKYGAAKYIYVGSYAGFQIRKMMELFASK